MGHQEPPAWHQHSEQPQAKTAARGLSLNLPKNIWPSRDTIATPDRPLLTDFPSSPDYSMSHIYHEIPEAQHQPQPIHRPIQASLFNHQSGSSCASTSSSGYGSSSIRYDNVRGEARGPFVAYPILEDRSFHQESSNCTPSRLKRPTELALNHNSPLI